MENTISGTIWGLAAGIALQIAGCDMKLSEVIDPPSFVSLVIFASPFAIIGAIIGASANRKAQ